MTNRCWKLGGLVVGLCLVLANTGCSDSGTTHDGGLGDAGARGSLSVTVEGLSVLLSKIYLPGKPLSGALVAADLPGGTREEKMTGADGKVTFKDVDWSRGTADITAYVKGYGMRSVLGITRADGDQKVGLMKQNPPLATITVSGILNNPTSGLNEIVIGATSYGNVITRPAGHSPSPYSLEVEPGKPFSIFIWQMKLTNPGYNRVFQWESLGLTKVDHAGSTSAVKLDIDLSQQVATTKVKGTMVLPSDPGSIIGPRGVPRWWIKKVGSTATLGFCEKTTLGKDNTFSYEGSVYNLASTADIQTQFLVPLDSMKVGSGEWSRTILDGYPEDGHKVSSFLDQPELVNPSGVPWRVKASDTIRFKNPGGVSTVFLGFNTGTPNTQNTWTLRTASPDATSFSLPELPTEVNKAEIFGSAGAVYAWVWLCGDRDPVNWRCGRIGVSKRFEVTAD